jgi:uncharacterized protein (DUF952 family)
MTSIFKVCAAVEWREAETKGFYEGSADDRRDGFIHFSTLTQLAGTLAKHFPGRDDLVLVAVQAEALGDALKWEPSRGGALFPHLYAALPMKAVLWVRPLLRDEHGGYLLPPEAGT